MLKKTITYENFNGEKVTKDLYFNLTKKELIDLQVSKDGGLDTYIKKITEEEDKKAMIQLLDSIILAAYGQKSEDGERFIKNKELIDAFVSSMAYDALIDELFTVEGASLKFIIGLLPKDITSKINN